MPHNLLVIFGVASGVINFMGLLPYIRDIFLKKTKPERAMWWIYTGLFLVLFAAQLRAGAHWVLVLTAASVVSSVLIAGLSIKYGYGSFHKRDAISILVAIVGLVAWGITRNPLSAILMIIVVDLAGFWLTLVKTWHAPHTETLVSWQLSFVASVCSILAAGTWKLAVISTRYIRWLAPVYSCGSSCSAGLVSKKTRLIFEPKPVFISA